MLSTSKFSQNRGFSLIEVMMALIILSVGTLGLTGMILTSSKLQPAQQDQVTSMNFAYRLFMRLSNNGSITFPTKTNQTICETITGYSNGAGESNLNCYDSNNPNNAGKGYVTLDDGSANGLFVWLVFNVCPNAGNPAILTDLQTICGAEGQYSSTFDPAVALPYEVTCTPGETADPANAKRLRVAMCIRDKTKNNSCNCTFDTWSVTNPAA